MKSKEHAIFRAIERKDTFTLKDYISGGGDPDLKDESGQTLLMACILAENIEAASWLITIAGANPGYIDKYGCSPLSLALTLDNDTVGRSLARLLLRPNRLSTKPAVVLFRDAAEAAWKDWVEVVQVYCQSGGSVWPSASSCRTQSNDKLLGLKGADQELDPQEVDGLLHVAARGDACKVLQYLLQEFQIDPNRPNALGYTALHLACESGYEKAALELLKCPRIDIHAKDPNGMSCLNAIHNRGFLACVSAAAEKLCESDPNLSHIHIAREFSSLVSHRFPGFSVESLNLMPVSTLLASGRILPHATCLDKSLLVPAASLSNLDPIKILFVSHRWEGGVAADPKKRQFNILKEFLESKQHSFDFVWLAYSCVHHMANGEANVLHYIMATFWASHALVIPSLRHIDALEEDTGMNITASNLQDFTYRGWCKLDVLLNIITGSEITINFQINQEKHYTPLTLGIDPFQIAAKQAQSHWEHDLKLGYLAGVVDRSRVWKPVSLQHGLVGLLALASQLLGTFEEEQLEKVMRLQKIPCDELDFKAVLASIGHTKSEEEKVHALGALLLALCFTTGRLAENINLRGNPSTIESPTKDIPFGGMETPFGPWAEQSSPPQTGFERLKSASLKDAGLNPIKSAKGARYSNEVSDGTQPINQRSNLDVSTSIDENRKAEATHQMLPSINLHKDRESPLQLLKAPSPSSDAAVWDKTVKSWEFIDTEQLGPWERKTPIQVYGAAKDGEGKRLTATPPTESFPNSSFRRGNRKIHETQLSAPTSVGGLANSSSAPESKHKKKTGTQTMRVVRRVRMRVLRPDQNTSSSTRQHTNSKDLFHKPPVYRNGQGGLGKPGRDFLSVAVSTPTLSTRPLVGTALQKGWSPPVFRAFKPLAQEFKVKRPPPKTPGIVFNKPLRPQPHLYSSTNKQTYAKPILPPTTDWSRSELDPESLPASLEVNAGSFAQDLDSSDERSLTSLLEEGDELGPLDFRQKLRQKSTKQRNSNGALQLSGFLSHTAKPVQPAYFNGGLGLNIEGKLKQRPSNTNRIKS